MYGPCIYRAISSSRNTDLVETMCNLVALANPCDDLCSLLKIRSSQGLGLPSREHLAWGALRSSFVPGRWLPLTPGLSLGTRWIFFLPSQVASRCSVRPNSDLNNIPTGFSVQTVIWFVKPDASLPHKQPGYNSLKTGERPRATRQGA